MSKDKNKNIKKDLLIGISLTILSVVIILCSFEKPPMEGFGYSVNKKANYKVGVKENNFFNNEYIEMNQTYISSVVDKLLIDFNYEFKGNNKENIDYTYDVIAIMNVRYNNTKESLWTEENTIIEKKEIKLEQENKFNINESIEVDYNAYNNKAKQFKANFNIPVKSTLEVILTVNKSIDSEEKIEQVDTISLKMDLNEDVFKIEEKVTGLSTYKQIIDGKETNIFLLIIGLVIFIPSICITIKKLMKISGLKQDTGTYVKAMKKILKNYGDIVAEIVRPVELNKDTQIIDVKNFDQLLDVEEELRMPILFYEVERGKEGCFIIINNNVAYRYILKNKKK